MGLDANLSGLLGGLVHMGEGLARAAGGEAQSVVIDTMAERGRELIVEGFDAQRSPNGAPWAPPVQDYGHQLLDKTGDMKSSADCLPGPRDDTQGFSLTFEVTDEKAPWHQYGTKRGRASALTHPLRAQDRKSGRAGPFFEGNERQHIPARPMIFADGERPDRWITGLEAVGQSRLNGWLDSNVRI